MYRASVSLDLSKTDSPVLTAPEYIWVVTLVTIYLVCGVLSILVVVFLLDKLHDEEKKEKPPMFHLFFATLFHLRDVRMILLIPLTIYSGLEQGFVFADFTKVRY
jgi:hypothetical protein